MTIDAGLAVPSRAMRRPFLDRPVALLGQYLPMASLVLIVVAVIGSALLSLTTRLGVPSISLALLSPSLVAGGQIWRLATWAFFTGIQGGDLAGGAAVSLFLFPVLVAVAILFLNVARRTEVT